MFTLILIQFDIDILNQLLRQQNSVVNEYFRGVNRAFFGSLPTQIPFKVNIIAKSTLQTIHLSAHNLIFFIENYAFLWEHLTQLDFFRIFWNVEICLYFEPPFVLVLRRMPLENKGAVIDR